MWTWMCLCACASSTSLAGNLQGRLRLLRLEVRGVPAEGSSRPGGSAVAASAASEEGGVGPRTPLLVGRVAAVVAVSEAVGEAVAVAEAAAVAHAVGLVGEAGLEGRADVQGRARLLAPHPEVGALPLLAEPPLRGETTSG